MSTSGTRAGLDRFEPSRFTTFRFIGRELDASGRVSLRYALDEEFEFEEVFKLPVSGAAADPDDPVIEGLLALLHWVAGVSYYKTAATPEVACETGLPGRSTALLLEALYTEGLGEFAVVNDFDGPVDVEFPHAEAQQLPPQVDAGLDRRALCLVGGGKDSVVAIEVMRRSCLDVQLFSVGDPPPIARTVAVAELPRLLATRHIDGQLLGPGGLNASGALNGHVPVTAIITVAALLSAALNGFDTVVLANERSASSPNLFWNGVGINHQFSKSFRAEELMRAALAEVAPRMQVFSVLRPASELSIARAFSSKCSDYHSAFTSCNRLFHLDRALRSERWCCRCDKCRFVFLILAPFMRPGELARIFGSPMLDDTSQFPEFAKLFGRAGHKPFECVGEPAETVAALRLLARDQDWMRQSLVERLVREILPGLDPLFGDPDQALSLDGDHFVPASVRPHVVAFLGS